MPVRLATGTVAIVLVVLALCLYLIPEHWLRYVRNFATVTIDGRRVEAESYLGNPTDNEADAFLFVKMDHRQAYLFSFEDEKYTEAATHEFVRLPWGMFLFGRMSQGPWHKPLPTIGTNEFSIKSSTGQLIVVKF